MFCTDMSDVLQQLWLALQMAIWAYNLKVKRYESDPEMEVAASHSSDLNWWFLQLMRTAT